MCLISKLHPGIYFKLRPREGTVCDTKDPVLPTGATQPFKIKKPNSRVIKQQEPLPIASPP